MLESETLKNQPIIITGMHRSGTSLTASILQGAGVNVGEELLGGSISSNIRGHFEDLEFLSLHQEFLMSQGISSEGWTSLSKINVPEQLVSKAILLLGKRSQQKSIWGWKDPRTVLFLDFWDTHLPNAKYVFVYRSPWEVIDSLFIRGDHAFMQNPKLAIEVWLAYNTAILDFYTHHSNNSILLHIDNVQGTENDLISIIAQKLNIHLNPLTKSPFRNSEIHTEVNHTHRPALLARHFPTAVKLYEKLEDVADLPGHSKFLEQRASCLGESIQDWVFQDWLMSKRLLISQQQAQTELQQTQAELQQAQAELQQAQAELQQAQAELQRTQAKSLHLQKTIEAMISSKFWQLRRAWFRLKRLVGLNDHE